MLREIGLSSAHRLLAPRPVCLLTTRYHGRTNVMTVAWVCPIGLEPPLLLLAVHPARYSHDLLARSEECVLNIPARPQCELALKLGASSGADEDKIALHKLALVDAQRVEAPRLDGCLAYLECAVIDRLSPGDHTLFVLQIAGAWAEEEAFGETWLLPEGNDDLMPLVHLGGREFCVPGRRWQQST
ncbi:MAG: flavin reductase family protein [Chloroflexi bacterium]|nr:flavin reductase family protein [Chloroflexota bacterium]